MTETIAISCHFFHSRLIKRLFHRSSYALIMLRAHELTGNTTLLAEAEAAFAALFDGSMS